MPRFFSRIVFPLALLVVLVAGVVSSADVPAAPRSVRVVLDDNYPPFSFLDAHGQLQGILVDQWRLWERKTGIRAELHGMDWGEALRRMKAGEFDVIDTVFETDQRRRFLEFGKPYQNIEVPAFFYNDIGGITDAASLRGFPVAVKEGDAAVDLLQRQGVTDLLYYPGYEAIVRAAAERRIRIFVADKPPALYYLNKYGLTDEFRATRPLQVGAFHRAVRKGNAALLGTVESGFAAISPAEYRRIDRKWYGTGLMGGGSLRYLAMAVAAAVGLVCGLVVWNLLLRRAVNRRTAELAAGEERYRTLMDSIPLGISVVDRNYRIVMANRTQAELFGHPTDWFAGRYCYEEYEKREAVCTHCPGTVSMATGSMARADAEGVRDDGSSLTVRIRTVPLRDPDGAPNGFIEVVEDITDRKRTERHLDRERTRLRTLLQTIPDLVWLKDPDGRFLFCNARFEQLCGAAEADVVGRTDYDFVDTALADFFRDYDRRAIAAGGPTRNEEWVTFAADGHRELLETIKTPMYDGEGNLIGVLGIARDITSVREAHQRLEEELVRGQKLESLGVLAGGIAHDFNNVLTGILGNISLARLLVGDDPKVISCLAESEKAAKRAGELTRQLLTFARGGEPVLKTVDPRHLVEESLTFALRGANVKGTMECPASVWCIDADPGQMSQVFNNLLINAKQAMSSGGTVTVTMENRLVRDGDLQPLKAGRYVQIDVRDEGTGIPPEHLPKVFDPYFSTKAEGSGLGLASVYSIARRHGGMVTVSSTSSAGTTFTLLIPAAPEGAVEAPAPGEVSRAGTGRVLVMDDETMIREVAVAMLAELGYAATACIDGGEAVRLHAAARQAGAPFSAIILDLTVPGGMGGREAAQQIRSGDPQVPLIVSSGYSGDTAVAEYAAYGFTGSVTKPYDLKHLSAELARVIAPHHPPS